MRKLLLSSLILFLCVPAYGATQLKKTVCPSGCDYTSLEAAMNGNEQNLVTADKYFDVEISGTWSSADTTAVTIHNYTTDATRYINIYTTGSARHDGTAYKSGAYKLAPTGGFPINLAQNSLYCTIDGLVLQIIGDSAYNAGITGAYGGTSQYVKIVNNVIYMASSITAGSPSGIYLGSSGTHTVYNNIVYGVKTSNASKGRGIFSQGAADQYNNWDNNTVYGNDTGFYGASSRDQIRNNISYNNTTDYYGTFGGSSSNNISKDTTAAGTDGDSKTISFVSVTGGSENFHLASTDTDAIDKGADLSGTFTTDIDGTTRSGTWDIGADEYVASGPSIHTTILRNAVIRNAVIR